MSQSEERETVVTEEREIAVTRELSALDAIIIGNRLDGLSLTAIAELLTVKYGHKLSYQAVQQRLHKISADFRSIEALTTTILLATKGGSSMYVMVKHHSNSQLSSCKKEVLVSSDQRDDARAWLKKLEENIDWITNHPGHHYHGCVFPFEKWCEERKQGRWGDTHGHSSEEPEQREYNRRGLAYLEEMKADFITKYEVKKEEEEELIGCPMLPQ